MSTNPSLFLSVGKPVKDEYGCGIGKIASFAVTPNGKFDSVYIELGDGSFSKFSAEHLRTNGTEITLVSNIKAQAGILCDDIPLIWRKDQALRDLSDKKKISKEMYTELHTNFDGLLSKMKNEAQALLEEIDDEIVNAGDAIKGLTYALVNLEIEHEIGKIDNTTYDTALAMIQANLKRTQMEKTDLELTRSKLANVMLGDSTKTKLPEAPKPSNTFVSSPNLPEPPVVVYVKEIGKAGV